MLALARVHLSCLASGGSLSEFGLKKKLASLPHMAPNRGSLQEEIDLPGRKEQVLVSGRTGNVFTTKMATNPKSDESL